MAQDGTTDARADLGRPNRILWAVGALVVLALVVGAVVGALREPVELDAGTPEGVVQRYVQAVIDEDHRRAVGYLTEEAAAGCPPSALRSARVPESLSATLDEVTVTGREAEVRVRMRSTAEPPPFGDSGYGFDETFFLERQDGSWRLTDGPWPLRSCERLP